MFWRIFFRSVRRRPFRLAVAVWAMAIGTAGIAALTNLAFEVKSRIQEESAAFGATGVIVPSLAGSTKGGSFGPIREPGRLGGEGRERLARLLAEEKIAYAEFLYAIGTIGGRQVVLVGTPWETGSPLVLPPEVTASRIWALEGTALKGVGRDGLVPAYFGARLYESLELAVGETIPIGLASREFDVRIAGGMTGGGDEDWQVFLPLADLQDALGLEGFVSAIPFRSPRGEEGMARLRQEVSRVLPGWTVETNSRVVRAEKSLHLDLQLFLGFAALWMLIGSALTVWATMLATVMERQTEVGLFRALGGGANIIRAQFLLEGALAGGMGSLAGLLAGWAGSWGISQAVFGRGVGLSPWTVPVTLLVGLAVSGAAVILPLRRALRDDPIASLRGAE